MLQQEGWVSGVSLTYLRSPNFLSRNFFVCKLMTSTFNQWIVISLLINYRYWTIPNTILIYIYIYIYIFFFLFSSFYGKRKVWQSLAARLIREAVLYVRRWLVSPQLYEGDNLWNKRHSRWARHLTEVNLKAQPKEIVIGCLVTCKLAFKVRKNHKHWNF